MRDYAPLLDTLGGRKFKRILDVGCGKGELVHLLAERGMGKLIVGADKDRAKFPRRKNSKIRFVAARAESLPFHNASFDLVVTTFAIHEFDDQLRGLAEIRRVLSSDGLLVGLDWTKGASVAPGQRPLEPHEMERLLSEAGFSKIVVRSLPQKRMLITAHAKRR